MECLFSRNGTPNSADVTYHRYAFTTIWILRKWLVSCAQRRADFSDIWGNPLQTCTKVSTRDRADSCAARKQYCRLKIRFTVTTRVMKQKYVVIRYGVKLHRERNTYLLFYYLRLFVQPEQP